MIERNMFFIWIGNSIPTYGPYAISMFQELNPTFALRFYHIKNVNDTSNQDFNDYVRLTQDDSSFYHKMFNRDWSVRKLSSSQNGTYANYSDGFRIYLINKYGGIYLDLDTFPVKPFDDFLMNRDNFIVSRFKGKFDIFFFGCAKGKLFQNFMSFNDIDNSYKILHTDLTLDYNAKLDKIFKMQLRSNAEKFIRNDLKYGSHSFPKELVNNYYIDHFRTQTWK